MPHCQPKPSWNFLPSPLPAIRCSRSLKTSAIANAAAWRRAAIRSSSGWAIRRHRWCSSAKGPGADEDAQGIPFVGRAGQLLTQMIEGTAKKEGIEILRKDIYICNVVKCRPPENRNPEPDEMEICGQFLHRQLSTIRPKAICALGGIAARALTGHKEGVTKMRGKVVQVAGNPGDGDLPPLVLTAAVQSGS